ncbi:hypothetical protein Pelo_17303 [Pelomyxa schiedti]|nr:hypothetical protein Pelo_17303 [Pelomyxa schiedti]
MYLPASEILVGRTLQALAQRGRVSEDINYINPDWWPTSFGSFAGYNENVCPPAEITNSSSSEGQNGTVSNSSSAADESQYGTAISLPVAQSLTLILCICALLFV